MEAENVPSVLEDDFLGRKKNGVYHVTCVGVAELLGTATYVFVACLGNLKGFTEEGPSMLQIGMVSGIGVMMAIHVSCSFVLIIFIRFPHTYSRRFI